MKIYKTGNIIKIKIESKEDSYSIMDILKENTIGSNREIINNILWVNYLIKTPVSFNRGKEKDEKNIDRETPASRIQT